jgi:hypothetical protein
MQQVLFFCQSSLRISAKHLFLLGSLLLMLVTLVMLLSVLHGWQASVAPHMPAQYTDSDPWNG